MSAQVRPIGKAAFAIAAFSVSVLALSVRPNIALAVDCLVAPNFAPPPNGHWYYGTDRVQQRKCWHLRTDNGSSQNGARQTAGEAPAKPALSVAADGPHAGTGFKDLVAQHEGTKLSDQDVDRLYAEFLEWKRHSKN
jgi:hypothetical protein